MLINVSTKKERLGCNTACRNEGLCIEGKCQCSLLFKGVDCTEINEGLSWKIVAWMRRLPNPFFLKIAFVKRCSSNICHNGGTCYELGKNKLKCVCKSEYYGQYCEKAN